MDNNMTLEQANALLEQTVKKLENRDLSLEESLEEYAKACKLLAFCKGKLNEAKGKIEDINTKIAEIQRNGGELFE